MALLPQFCLKFVKINGAAVLDHIMKECDIRWAKAMAASNCARVGIQVVDGAKVFIVAESCVCNGFLDTKERADVFDRVSVFKKNGYVEFGVIGDNLDWHGGRVCGRA
jgi:hypothetical protein